MFWLSDRKLFDYDITHLFGCFATCMALGKQGPLLIRNLCEVGELLVKRVG